MPTGDGMAPEGLPEEVEDALDGVMERVEGLSRVLAEHGYDAGTAVFDIARDELIEALGAENEDAEDQKEENP